MTPQKDITIQVKRLSNDKEYFSNVFKRIEKIVSVIFYITANLEDKKDNVVHSDIIKDRALQVHEVSLETLRLQTQDMEDGLRELLHTLVALESTLRIAEAAKIIPVHINQLIFEQLIGVERYITNHYLEERGVSLEDAQMLNIISKQKHLPATTNTVTRRVPTNGNATRRRPVNIPSNDISSDAYLVYSQLTDRAERIKTVLEAKPQATIKDIAEIITDVSEKTIQRELNSLIEKGQVHREGERRWSKYSVVK
jgi:hypothetical protein